MGRKRIQEFESEGSATVQSGRWMKYLCLLIQDAATTIFETYFFPPLWNLSLVPAPLVRDRKNGYSIEIDAGARDPFSQPSSNDYIPQTVVWSDLAHPRYESGRNWIHLQP